MRTIRAFIAVELPEEITVELERVGSRLAAFFPDGAVRRVRPDRMHLTLRFLGDTPLDRLTTIGQALEAAVQGRQPFEVMLNAVGCFPHRRRPRVLWVGLRETDGQLQALKEAIDAALAAAGEWERDRKSFRPHLTVGRLRDNRQSLPADWAVPVAPLSISVAAVHLIESRLLPSGPEYSQRYVAHLRPA